MNYFISRIRRVSFNDLIQIWKLLVCFVPAFIYKRLTSPIWIVSEAPNEARDNGFWFFQYVRKEHLEQQCWYAINKASPDFEKVKTIGPVVEHGSLKHWFLYLAADKIISSQKAMGPNAAICGALEVYGLLKNHRMFLQHGVIKDDLKWLYYDITKFELFICGAFPEYEYVEKNYGYPNGVVQYTGLCRFDGLHDYEMNSKQILIMPTWREWIADEDQRLKKMEGSNSFTDTEYYKAWSSFITNSRVKELSEKYGVHFVFFPHREMQKYLEYFPKSNEYISIVGAKDYDVQKLLKESAMMITDYSSVFFDMIYMKKPIVFYQFDYDKFRFGQYKEGYFDYRNNPFGNSHEGQLSVFDAIEEMIINNFNVTEKYLEAHHTYFKHYDANNCYRVYEAIMSHN